MIVSCLAANGAVICSPKKSSTGCKAHWDICEMRYIRTSHHHHHTVYDDDDGDDDDN
jgi:hypothetical protein